MDMGGSFPGGEARRGVCRLFKDPEAATHGAPDSGVVVEFDGDVLRLHDLPLVSHTNGDKVWGHVDPEALGTLVRRVSVWGGVAAKQRDWLLAFALLRAF